jgi:hypothetical protein
MALATKTRTATAVVLTGLTLAVAAVSWWKDRSAHAAVEARTQATLTQELDRLRQDVDRLKKRPVTRPIEYLERSEAVSSAAEPSSLPSARVDPQAEQERQLELQSEVFEKLETRFKNEVQDANWSRLISWQIRDALAQKVPRAELLQVNCASTLCRVVVRHEDSANQVRFGQDVAWLEPFRPGVVYDYDTVSNPPVTTMLVLREGYSFRDDGDAGP